VFFRSLGWRKVAEGLAEGWRKVQNPNVPPLKLLLRLILTFLAEGAEGFLHYIATGNTKQARAPYRPYIIDKNLFTFLILRNKRSAPSAFFTKHLYL
jgi:hypothetical protein